MDRAQVQAALYGDLSSNGSLDAGASDLPVHHIISGSFRSISLFLLAFSPLNRTISHVQTIPAFGPHQYLSVNAQKDRVYTTSWAQPPSLSSWAVDRTPQGAAWKVDHVNTVPITATSSYITIPPPFIHIYSVGGPTGEVHAVDASTGGFGSKIQQILFVPEDELEKADKTRVALRYGSHAFELSSRGFAFVPVLGTNTIEVYRLSSSSTGTLDHIGSTDSPRPHDGPRHLIVSPNGSKLYVITEHTNYIDVYDISLEGKLIYLQSKSVIPSHLRSSVSSFRGDTLRLTPPTPSSPSPRYLIATTRGATTATRGWVAIFKLDDSGSIVSAEETHIDNTHTVDEDGVERWQTPTSGGKANAIEILPHDQNPDGVWIVLTDDDESVESGGPGVRVLEWNGWATGGIRVVAQWPDGEEAEEAMRGGSHAIWLD